MKNYYAFFFTRNYLRIAITIILSYPFSLSAQEETAFPNDYGIWEVGYYWMDVEPTEGSWSTVTHHFEASPSPDSDTLMMLLENGIWLGNYYSTADKVYLSLGSNNQITNFSFGSDTGVYHLLYDFTLEVGDTAYLDAGPQYVTIDSITMEDLNGDTLKHFYLSNSDIIVEKIGSLQGLFRPYERPFEIHQNLCSNSGSFITAGSYTDYGYYMENCLPSSVGLETNEMNAVNAYPNPANDKLTITTASPLLDYTVYSTTGTVIETPTSLDENELELDVSRLPSGIYFLELKHQNGNSSRLHFMKD
ncbi:T9SS type A sorting domain-containing protein [Fluviicola sp.]|uniref:T9SS type A sorting domain-containing protein n=1 Tax=Fluviicola sp. TaxID=1917219 RepID=UPI003D2BC7EC